jgi:heme-degrading monooxygenase HmoA
MMIARVWHGVVPASKADAYGEYLARSDRGVSDYQATPGNRGAWLLRRTEGDRVRFMLVSLWDSRASTEAYAGADIDRARYFHYDLECLIDPTPSVEHYEVLAAPQAQGS